MKINHTINNYNLEWETENSDQSLLLTDKSGGYFWKRNKQQSRYQGWFVNLNNQLFKIIDKIEILDSNNNEIKNEWINRRQSILISDNNLEKYYIGIKHLKYKLSRICDIFLDLDIRKSFNFPKWERYYKIYDKNNFLVIKYENSEHSNIFLAIPKKNFIQYQTIGKWKKRKYTYDEKRKSSPNELYIYEALKIKTNLLIIGVGLSKEEAIKNTHDHNDNGTVFNNNFKPDLQSFSCHLSKQALESLVIESKDHMGLYAGLPWFFQFWLRDEAISLKGLYETCPKKAERLAKQRLQQISDNTFPKKVITSSDGILWYIYRILENPSLQLKHHKVERLVNIAERIYKTEESWMDTLKRKDSIENNCLQLAIYNFAYKITKKDKFLKREKQLQRITKQSFWNGEYLADKKDDWTIRPNIFLAYYLYTKLLKKKEWETCFDHALNKLWCNWGGITTISKDHFQNHPQHTGENPLSYHQGDSWFWINNIAALSMRQLNRTKYQKKIKKIMETSIKDLLICGAVGFSSELSSSDQFKPSGSPVQAWSLATLIELLVSA